MFLLKNPIKKLVLIFNLNNKQPLLFQIQKNTEKLENMLHTEVTEISIWTGSTLVQGFFIPKQVPTKTIRRNYDIHNDQITSERAASTTHSSDVHNHQF